MSERLLVNASIGRLLEGIGDWKEDAAIVVAYGSKLPDSKGVRIRVEHNKTKGGDSISGVSPGQGDVEIKTERKKEIVEKTFGFEKDRVGEYRLWRDGKVVFFHHFWKSEPTTRGITDNDPDEFRIGYTPSTLEPNYCAVLRKRVHFRIKWLGLTLYKQYLHPIGGNAPSLYPRDLELEIGK